ncbi:unnamed protein product [Peniophora sp. CBMAI 1063]|nr:unnamed protein product [Peniophora sp. CBMAI 1063]
MTGRIVLLGATGGLGREVLAHILHLVAPTDLIIASPSPTRVRATWPHLSKEVEIREGDYTRPETLPGAFAHADTLFLVSYPSIARTERVVAHKTAIDAARAAGVRRVVYTSLAFGDSGTAVVMRAHLDTEVYLKASGLEYTIIREGLYIEAFPMHMGFFDAQRDTDVYVPGDGPVAWAARVDLGEATARIIADGLYTNETVLLSGPARNVRTLTQIAQLCSAILARPVRLHVVSEDEYVERHTDPSTLPRGDPEFLRQWATSCVAMSRGETGVVSPALEDILGRRARGTEECLRELIGKEQDAITQYAK